MQKYVHGDRGNIADILDVVSVATQAKVTPLLRGVMGIGKSTMMRRLARGLGLDYIVLYGVRMEAVDVRGLPFIKDGVTGVAIPDWAKWCMEKPCFLFLDELDKAPDDVRRALLEVLLDKAVGGMRFHPKTTVVAAINPVECGGKWELTEDIITRCLNLTFPVDEQGWIEGMLSGDFDVMAYDESPYPVRQIDPNRFDAAMTAYRSVFAGFIKANPSVLFAYPTDWAGEPFPTPRGWVLAKRLMAGLDAAGFSLQANERLYRLALQGTVGVDAATEFLSFIINLDLPTPEDILNNPQLLPTQMHTLSLALMNLSVFVERTIERFDEAVTKVVAELERRQKLDLAVEYLRWIKRSGATVLGESEVKKRLAGLLKGKRIIDAILA